MEKIVSSGEPVKGSRKSACGKVPQSAGNSRYRHSHEFWQYLHIHLINFPHNSKYKELPEQKSEIVIYFRYLLHKKY